MRYLIYILLLLPGGVFAQGSNMSNADIERYAQTIDGLRAGNKLSKTSWPDMVACGGAISGYYQAGELVLIDAVFGAELGFQSRTIYVKKGKFLKIIYKEHSAEWGKYDEQHPDGESDIYPADMTYADTTYTITLGSPVIFSKWEGGRVVSNKEERELMDELIACGNLMSGLLQKASAK